MVVNDRFIDDDRRVIIIERESGIGWVVAFIVLALAVGFGIILFMDQQSMIEYKIEQALDRMDEREHLAANGIDVDAVSPPPLPQHLQPKIVVEFPKFQMPKLPTFTAPSAQSLASKNVDANTDRSSSVGSTQ